MPMFRTLTAALALTALPLGLAAQQEDPESPLAEPLGVETRDDATSVGDALPDLEVEEPTSPLAEPLGVDPGPEEFGELDIEGLSVERLIGSPVFDEAGERVGNVMDVLIVEDAADALVVDLGSPLASGRPGDVVLPLGDALIEVGETDNLRVTTAADIASLDDHEG